MTLAMTGRRPTVVVIGAGFGGLSAVKALRKAPVRTVVLDRNNYHLFQPLLYQVGTALLDETDIAAPVRPLLRKVHNAEFRLGDVSEIDLAGKRVITDQGVVKYDYLIVAAGAQTNFFGNQSVEQHSIGLKNLDDALALRSEILRRFEQAKWTEDGVERRRLLSFVVVGGGSTGVETAGAIVELAKYVIAKDYRTLRLSDVSVTLLEASDRILAPYDQKLQIAAMERLKWMGVKVLRSSAVDRVDGDEIHLTNGNTLRGLLVWAAGVRGADIAKGLTDRLGRQGRVPVNSYLQLAGHPEVFVIGDIAEIPSADGPLPMLGPVATQSGKHAVRNLLAVMRGQHLEPFRYWDKGTMSTIGRNAAIVQVGKLRITGFIGWAMWLFVHLALIVNFRSQLTILINWFWHYLSNDRPARILQRTAATPRASTSAPPAVALPATAVTTADAAIPDTPAAVTTTAARRASKPRATGSASAKKAAAKTTSPTAKKAAAKKPAAKKPAAKKSAAEKPAAEKPAVKKPAVKKPAAKKPAAKKPAAKKSTAEKPAAKKAAAKKPAAKKAPAPRRRVAAAQLPAVEISSNGGGAATSEEKTA